MIKRMLLAQVAARPTSVRATQAASTPHRDASRALRGTDCADDEYPHESSVPTIAVGGSCGQYSIRGVRKFVNRFTAEPVLQPALDHLPSCERQIATRMRERMSIGEITIGNARLPGHLGRRNGHAVGSNDGGDRIAKSGSRHSDHAQLVRWHEHDGRDPCRVQGWIVASDSARDRPALP